VSRFADRGAITAAYVGIGMAVTIVGSFMLIIPIEFVIWLLALPSGLLIGYYANARSNRGSGPWSRLISNGLVAAVATGLTMAVLILLFKALFFFADGGYPDFNRVDRAGIAIPPFCQTGADCVYSRYVAAARGPDLAAAGAVDASTFTGFYWSEQFRTAATVLLLTVVGGVGGAVLYGVAGPKATARQPETVAPIA
jgi:hypothetical protein